MPEFTGTKISGQLVYDDYQSRQEYINKLANGVRFKELLRRPDKGKTNEQLGYYWGLLLPEIHKQYIEDGITVSVRVSKALRNDRHMVVDRSPTIDDSHEIVKSICGLVGDDGQQLDMSDMGKWQTSKFIDHVLLHATNDLSMNGEALEAKRPQLETCTAGR